MSESKRLSGKVIVITGGTSNIGKGCATRAAAEGATVVVTGRDPARGAETEREITEAGGQAQYRPMDVMVEADWTRTIDEILSKHGRIDALVNNAGDCILKPIETLSLDTLWYMLQINLEAAFMGIKHGMPAIGKSGGGAIVNISSVAGIKAGPNSTGYGTSKAGMTNLTKTAAIEGASDKIRVNAVHPGLIWSGHSQVKAFGEEGAKKFRTMIEGKTPLHMVGAASDIAGIVAYLVSDQAKSVTGTEIVVDGGYAMA